MTRPLSMAADRPAGTDRPLTVEIRLARRGSRSRRRHEPVTLGLPLPRGAALNPEEISVADDVEQHVEYDEQVQDELAG